MNTARQKNVYQCQEAHGTSVQEGVVLFCFALLMLFRGAGTLCKVQHTPNPKSLTNSMMGSSG
jgi:hypothetical protein